jgi:calnexin
MFLPVFLVLTHSAGNEINLSEIPTIPEGSFFHFEPFNDDTWTRRWQVSTLPNVTGKWTIQETGSPQALPKEKMIYMNDRSSYYGLSTKFPFPLDLRGKTLVVQYEMRYQTPMECGGSYIKLFHNDNFEPETLGNETRYIIMFGPDKCGNDHKVHFIFRHKDKFTGKYEEKHLKEPPGVRVDRVTHLYTLIVRPDNSVEIRIDDELVKQANLLTDFDPSVAPPRLIDDPTDVKPADWVEDEEIDDPDARPPDDWDSSAAEYIRDPARSEPPPGWMSDAPRQIPDPSAEKPEDWDDDVLGEWEAPLVPNPACADAPGCGEFEPPLIKNPDYKGPWKPPKIENPKYRGPFRPRQIQNPFFYEDKHPHNFEGIVGVGFELWMVSYNVAYGNVFIGNDEAAAREWNKVHFLPKHKHQAKEQKWIDASKSPDPKRKKIKKKKIPKVGPGLTDGIADSLKELGTGLKDFGGGLKEFGGSARKAWRRLFEEYQLATLTMTVTIIFVPLIICCLTWGGSAPQSRRRHHRRRPKGEDVATKPATDE